jgi:nucleoside-diphosphate-sugar epimerase
MQLSLHYGMPARVARLFIPYGAPHKVIASSRRALKEKGPINLSCCTQTRDFLHVADVVRAYGALLEDMEEGRETFDIFNICSGRGVPLKEILLLMATTLGCDAGLLHFGVLPFPHGEGPVCYGDNSKALKLLKWKPESLEEGLRRFLSIPEDTE